ncbi:MAG TPA: endonuclease/exonuclease/phosphatase family protein [Leptospiraceae bacterium]|nr:endonuclease/exonuclease/phosphatase family protein [Leptospiraceae bacterium]HMW04992.1 endonuclease/exonuclease/phosphatase family protein [Leptospiraceae bacterium]HMX35102.1 endonuclease/exonuclease/phosphatase family protein [Leptospiraceae bacterium]HMY30787.1 endonuclease/exonuclease/phosphatase family protein [Leptospiraceae bacterium]HMZ66368.1 endonuclease/exonuclease/phosphatase family protein [Leptospiraceae bacterium]
MHILKKILITLSAILIVAILGVTALVYSLTYHPSDLQQEKVTCKDNAPTLQPGQTIKVLNWNVQFMAGKKYVFFFDVPSGNGPHERPEPSEITKTLLEVARIIKDEKPDIILLQEMDEDAKRTDNQDQLVELMKLLPNEYTCSSSAFYWRNKYLPHPRVKGSTGLKLSTISKYKIESSVRHALAIIPADPITKQFGLKRAVLESKMPIGNSKYISAMNTHLDAFAHGYDTMQRQIEYLKNLFNQRNAEKVDWFIGGDFNLLPPNFDLSTLYKTHQEFYSPKSEISVLFDSFKSAVPLEAMGGKDKESYYTHIANDPDLQGKADRTIDYIFHSDGLKTTSYRVRQKDTREISDHLPLIVEFQLPN